MVCGEACSWICTVLEIPGSGLPKVSLSMRTETVDEPVVGRGRAYWSAVASAISEGGGTGRDYLSIAKGDRRRGCDNGGFRATDHEGIP
jgi:hypothetical protein